MTKPVNHRCVYCSQPCADAYYHLGCHHRALRRGKRGRATPAPPSNVVESRVVSSKDVPPCH